MYECLSIRDWPSLFEWEVGDWFFVFEFCNTGEIVYSTREGDAEPEVLEIEMDEIRALLR